MLRFVGSLVVSVAVGFASLGPAPILMAQDHPYSLPKSDYAVPKSGGTVVAAAGSLTLEEDGTPVGSEGTLNLVTGGGLCTNDPGVKNECDLTSLGGGSGAPTDATYITQTANGSLSAEQALSSLSSGIMRVATTTGVITSLTNSSGIAANISDETGTGLLTFNTAPALSGAVTFGNGATSAGFYRFLEDSDNGSNYIEIVGQDNVATNSTVMLSNPRKNTLPQASTWMLGLGEWNPRLQSAPIFDDFRGSGGSTTTPGSDMNAWTMGNSGGTNVTKVASNGHPGITRLTPGTGGTAQQNIRTEQNTSIELVDGALFEWMVQIPTLSTATERYTVRVGINDSTTCSIGTDSIIFEYTDNVNSGAWTIRTRASSSTTQANTSDTVVANTWYRLTIQYEAGVGVHFYINGTETANSPINTNVPGAGEFMAANACYLQSASAGGPGAVLDIDYYYQPSYLLSR